MSVVYHRTMTIAGHQVFYREAGPSQAPTVLLLHGYPTSSHMFRELIPALADRYHVIAPDHLGFGQSDTPPVDEFEYSFDALASITDGLLDQLEVRKFAIYVQDYGAPIGWRLALAHPERVTAIISQNGNAYEAGFVAPFWAPIWTYAADPNPSNETALREALGLDAIRWQYLHGVADPSLVSPDTWTHDHALIQRPGNDAIQLRLFRDYITNVALYPRVHEYFRESQVPLLAVWGANDEIFGPDGARAFRNDLPDAEIHLLNAGHFALESDLDTVAGYIRGFLGRVVE
ncbi:alpha/beta fold hydrolase [Saccharopolyspora phatthalungensis]|uniref:Pimeloyl-ACP methyl ester carboxylesterase n=1 Tax=Saccharopolyspora phatthalungensis TaxID=664693 RepID=A0A840QKT4_9PSEU|nr:alpha/beta hydrolase [Saccharopolyspora phatthalungensis]MBB5159353.1 pimeloyl-ACP methyl ester carboxylesterase [Saccharopolyspora phatthalungensis]